jgi:inositol-phosphate transport system permease protein
LIPRIVTNTVVYVGSALAFTILGALLISLSTFRMNTIASTFFRTVFFLPRSVPPVVWAFIWSWSFEGTRFGVFNSILAGLGLKPVFWFTKYPMLIVVLANGFLGISLAMLVFSSALSMIPRELLDAAEVDGASYLRTSIHIIIPMLKWPIFTMVVWHLMSFINSYVYILLITEGGPYYATEVWALYGYDNAFKYFRYGYGSSLMMVLVWLTRCCSWLYGGDSGSGG